MPFITTAGEPVAEAEWQLDEPEQVLAAVHTLGTLADTGRAVRALEWPRGQPLRVLEPAASAFSSTLQSGSNWFGLTGELRLDEQRVLSLQQLLSLLHEGRGSRYIALGNGEYLALAIACASGWPSWRRWPKVTPRARPRA